MLHIIDNIYLSNLRDAENFTLIRENNIKIVCRLSEDHNVSIYGSLVLFYNFECEDNILSGDDMLTAAKTIFTMIDQTEHNVLVHCNEGQSSSVSVIIYYMMIKHGYSFNESLEYIKSIKSDIKPNSAFKKKLIGIENNQHHE